MCVRVCFILFHTRRQAANATRPQVTTFTSRATQPLPPFCLSRLPCALRHSHGTVERRTHATRGKSIKMDAGSNKKLTRGGRGWGALGLMRICVEKNDWQRENTCTHKHTHAHTHSTGKKGTHPSNDGRNLVVLYRVTRSVF